MAGHLSREEILGTALRLLDHGGLPALAMRRIASELGVQQSALYWHFDRKQDLLSSLADHIVSRVGPAQGDKWDRRIHDLSMRLRDELLGHPDGPELVATAFAFNLGTRELFLAYAADAEAAGLDSTDAETAASVLVHFVLGYVTNEQQHVQAARLGAIPADAETPGLTLHRFSDDQFAQGLRLIISGISSSAGRTPEADTHPGGR